MSKFIKVMTAKLEGYDTVRRFGVDILVQIIIVAIFYAVLNNLKPDGAEKLGASHFAMSLVIMTAITTFQIYRRKLAIMKIKGINVS